MLHEKSRDQKTTGLSDILRTFGILIWGFALASLIGWIYEEVCGLLVYGHFMERGILWLPLCPIYGFGAWLLYACAHKLKNPFGIILVTGIVSGIFEYICSYILEEYFHLYLWSYEGWIFSINDRISLLSCLFFGILAVLFIKAIVPFLRFCSRKIPLALYVIIAVLVLFMIGLDLMDVF